MRSLVLIISLLFAFASTQGQGAMFLRGSQPAPTPGAGLLDSYKGSAFAMAPDVLLYSTYSALDDIAGSETFGQSGQWSVAILRDSDNAIRSFTPGQVADGTANTWVQAAGAANGLVRRAYDQSVTALDVSNLNHADQTNTAEMPILFDSVTGLILENGKAAIDFSTSNLSGFETNQVVSGTASHTILYVSKTNDAASAPMTGNCIIDINNSTGSTAQQLRICLEPNYAIRVSGVITAPYTVDVQSLFFQDFSGVRVDDINVWQNNTQLSFSANPDILNINNNGTSRIGRTRERSLKGQLQMMCIWTPSQVLNRTAISGLINTEYNNIY